MSSADKLANQLAAYMDPYSQPEPSAETGPGASLNTINPPAYTSHIAPNTTGSSTSTNPFRRASQSHSVKKPTVVTSHARNPSVGGSPHRGPTSGTEKFPTLPTHHRRDGSLANIDDGPLPAPVGRMSTDAARRRSSAADPNHHGSPKTRPRRVSSLKERFPGDPSVRPLDMLRDDAKTAHRSPHLRREHMSGTDTIDRLDMAALKGYHHEGPYDAALLARNTESRTSPVAALVETTRETLKATPRENVIDAVQRHRPLDGVARVPSGQRDELGRLYKYEEGPDVLREPGSDMGRWPGIDYHPDDLTGKGEPAFSIERALRDKNSPVPTDGPYIELVDRPARRSSAGIGKSTPGVTATELHNGEGASSSVMATATASGAQPQPHESYAEWETGRRVGVGRSGSQRVSGEFKRRFGSLRGRGGKVMDSPGAAAA